MSFETDFWDKLTGNASLSTLISTRLYRDVAPEKPTVPYVVAFQVQGRAKQALPGNIAVDGKVLQYRIIAATADESISVREALRAALIASGYPVFFEDEHSDGDAASKLYRRDLTVRVAHG
jgi:hypothetical protein